MKKVSKSTIIRTLVLIVALINQGLVAFGHSPLPFNSDNANLLISFVFTGVASVVAWWKNNSFSQPAIQADHYLKSISNKK